MTEFDPIFDISGKTAIVTGASSGLGITFAEFLAERGANIVLSGRRVERLEKTQLLLAKRNLSSIAVPFYV